MIRATADSNVLVGYDVLPAKWVVELTGTDETDPLRGERVVLRLSLEQLVMVVSEVARNVPHALLAEVDPNGHLANRVRKQRREKEAHEA